MARPRLYRAGPVAALGGICLLAVAGCGSDMNTMQADMAGGGGISATAATTGGEFTRPFDSVPDSTGTTFYFVASNAGGAGVFTVPAAGGAAIQIDVGGLLVAPFGIAISHDDTTLFIADPAASDMTNEKGAIYSLPVAGGMPALVTGSIGLQPRGMDSAVESSAEQLYFSGIDPAGGGAALYKLPAAGGAATVIPSGMQLGDPSGVAVATSGDIYVADTVGGGDNYGRVVKVSGGTASVFYFRLRVGYPTGIALTMDEKTLLVSGLDGVTGGAEVVSIDLTTAGSTSFNTGIEHNLDSAGLHRARNTNLFSWADLSAGGGGAVYQVKIK